jgi:transposase-like protein
VLLNAVPHRERKEVSMELAGIFKQEKKEDALLNLAAFKAKYQKRYPEAIRSLCEDEEHLFTFYACPPVMHRYIRSTNAIESFGSQRAAAHGSDRRLHDGNQLSHHRLGRDAGYPFAQDTRLVSMV